MEKTKDTKVVEMETLVNGKIEIKPVRIPYKFPPNKS